MSIDEELVGFDARLVWLDNDRLWDEERRRTYLLRDAVERVFSTDSSVWPALFNGEVWGAGPRLLRWQGPSRPRWIGINDPLWENLEGLRARVSSGSGCGRVWLIAVSCLLEPELVFDGHLTPILKNTVPAEIDSDWALLGYDVADGSGTSGLSNCGYNEQERPRIAEAFGGRLNSFHLFDDPGPAREFRRMTDSRVPEHAPFFAYGLYRIAELDTGEPRLLEASDRDPSGG